MITDNAARRVLFIAGASSDMGVSYIESFHSEYDIILAHYCRSADRIAALRESIGDKIIPMQADFSDEADTMRLAELLRSGEHQPTHFLHFSSLTFEHKTFHKTAWSCFEDAFNVSFRSATILLQACLPAMKKNRFGRIVFVLSNTVCAAIAPKGISPYITEKYALLGLMRAVSAEYDEYGILTNSVSPAIVDTRFIAKHPTIILESALKNNKQRRMLSPDEVAPHIHNLLFENADGVCGQNIEIGLQ